MLLLRMDAAVRDETEEVKTTIAVDGLVEDVYNLFRLGEFALLDAMVNLDDILFQFQH